MREHFPLLYSLFNKIRRDLYLIGLKLSGKATDSESIFQFYFERNLFGDATSLSGTGSSLAATKSIRASIPSLLAELHVGLLIDVPCGDFFWAKELSWEKIQYVGADVVPTLIEQNLQKHTADGIGFVVLDILKDPLPNCDLILCRDLFIHFPNELVRTALKNIKSSGARYLLTTQYDGVKFNRDISLGSFRPINLTLPPFNLPLPERRIPDDDYHKIWRRTLSLWSVDNVPIYD